MSFEKMDGGPVRDVRLEPERLVSFDSSQSSSYNLDSSSTSIASSGMITNKFLLFANGWVGRAGVVDGQVYFVLAYRYVSSSDSCISDYALAHLYLYL